MKKKRKKYYSKWTKWEKCSKTCMTQRHRWCKAPKHCGSEMISQAAYCFTDGSPCKAWIQAMVAQGWDFSNTVRTVARRDYQEHRSRVTFGKDPLSKDEECGLANNTVTNWDLRKIIGGRPAKPGQWPWQVALLNRFREVYCGGTLISDVWILTAAHCVQRPIYARFGEYNLSVREGTEQTRRIKEVVIHPEYNAELVDSDIALLRVEGEKVSLPVACLPDKPLGARHGHTRRTCTIIGWGKTNPNHISGSHLLHLAQIPIVSRKVCKGVYKEHKITNNMICAGFKHGRKDSCLGDSGGPLLCKDSVGRWAVQGITSFGEGCGRKAKYGIYTKVSNYVQWIKQIITSHSP